MKMRLAVALLPFVLFTALFAFAAGQTTDGMVFIHGGSYIMGCSRGDMECSIGEKSAHEVKAGSFWMDTTEVTQSAYEKATGTNPSRFKGCPDCPVETVSWNEAVEYCSKAGKRLPTEAEWEYAARAGTHEARYGALDSIAWSLKNSGGKTHPVGRKQANAWGLYDMLGNVWEWTADWYAENYNNPLPSSNPRGPSSGSYRVVRGGAGQ